MDAVAGFPVYGHRLRKTHLECEVSAAMGSVSKLFWVSIIPQVYPLCRIIPLRIL